MEIAGDPDQLGGDIAWPPFPETVPDDPQLEFKKILYQAQVDAAVARYQAARAGATTQAAADTERSQAAWSNEYALAQAVQDAYLDVAKSAIDRAQSRAQFIQTAAAAISTAYAAFLALSFKVDSTSPTAQPLPVQGVLATVFLGLAIALATVYLAYLTKHDPVAGLAAAPSLGEYQARRVVAFIQWVTVPILSRVYFLHAAVVSLAVGVALLPVAYLQLPVAADIGLALAATAVVFVVPWILARIAAPRRG